MEPSEREEDLSERGRVHSLEKDSPVDEAEQPAPSEGTRCEQDNEESSSSDGEGPPGDTRVPSSGSSQDSSAEGDADSPNSTKTATETKLS